MYLVQRAVIPGDGLERDHFKPGVISGRIRGRFSGPDATANVDGAEIEEVKFALAQLSDVKIVEGNNILTSSRQALNSLPIGIALFTALQITALLILVSLLFSAIVQERYREVGLLAAIVAVTVSALLGVIGAFVPAWRVRRMAPHTLIQSESPAR